MTVDAFTRSRVRTFESVLSATYTFARNDARRLTLSHTTKGTRERVNARTRERKL